MIYHFKNIIVGNGNYEAVEKVMSVLTASSNEYQSLFIYGKSGLGKTLLLKEILRYLEENTEKKVRFVTMERLLDDLIKAMKLLGMCKESKAYELFVNTYTAVDVLIIDDVQDIKDKYTAQYEMCSIIDKLRENNKLFIMASSIPRDDLEAFDEELRMRMLRGETCSITYPDYEMKRKILKKLVDEKYMEADIGDEEMDAIARRTYGSICTLEGTLLKLAASHNLQGKYGVEKPVV